MLNLIDVAVKMLYCKDDLLKQLEYEHLFIENLTYSNFTEIEMMLDVMDEKHWLEFPVWARIITYRLACLLKTGDAKIRRRAAAGLLSFGPDWDLEAERLTKEAEQLEHNQK